MSNAEILKIRQRLPLADKVLKTKLVLKQFIESHGGEDGCYVSFSGGKDSVALAFLVSTPMKHLFPEFPYPDLDLCWPDIPWVFANTGVELPDIVQFVKSLEKDHPIEIILPSMTFRQVVKKYGYPVISKEQAQFIREARTTKSDRLRDIRLNGRENGRSKVSEKWKIYLAPDAPMVSHMCCFKLKKAPFKKYEKSTGRVGILGTMAEESQLRAQQYSKHGCIIENKDRSLCTPMGFWRTQDVWDVIHRGNLPYCQVYNEPEIDRTGCSGCMFGVTSVERFEKFKYLARVYPKWFWVYWEINGMKDHFRLITGLDFPPWIFEEGFEKARVLLKI